MAEKLLLKLEKEGLPTDKMSVRNLLHRKTVYDGFSVVVDRLSDLTGFSAILKRAQGRRQFSVSEVVKLIITQRFHLPASNLRTYERQENTNDIHPKT